MSSAADYTRNRCVQSGPWRMDAQLAQVPARSRNVPLGGAGQTNMQPLTAPDSFLWSQDAMGPQSVPEPFQTVIRGWPTYYRLDKGSCTEVQAPRDCAAVIMGTNNPTPGTCLDQGYGRVAVRDIELQSQQQPVCRNTQPTINIYIP